jgi:L-serine deaminase
METGVAAVLLICVAVLVAMMALTAVGERGRGHGLLVALVAGAFFPITWAVWYVRDEHPYRS